MESEYYGVGDLSYLAVGPVNLVDHVSKQNLFLHGAVEFLVLGVLADLKVVSFEGLAHAEIKHREVSHFPHTYYANKPIPEIIITWLR